MAENPIQKLSALTLAVDKLANTPAFGNIISIGNEVSAWGDLSVKIYALETIFGFFLEGKRDYLPTLQKELPSLPGKLQKAKQDLPVSITNDTVFIAFEAEFDDAITDAVQKIKQP